jgi:hypothetical protein
MAELEKKYQELKNRLSEIYDLDMVGALLSWDQSAYMPPVERRRVDANLRC